MADYNSSLPVRTQAAGDVIAKLADATTPSQQLAISAAGAAKVEATDLDIRDLDFATDSVDVSGSSVIVSATDLDIRDLSSATDSVTAMQGGSPWGVNLTQVAGVAISSTQAVPSRLSDGAGYYDAREIRALDSSTDSVTAIIASSAGDPVNDLKIASSIAAGSSDDHDYTVTAGKTLTLTGIEASASGKSEIDVQIETGVATDVFVDRFIMFNSTASPNMSLKLSAPILVAAGVRVRVTVFNRDVAAMNLYSTICGSEA